MRRMRLLVISHTPHYSDGHNCRVGPNRSRARSPRDEVRCRSPRRVPLRRAGTTERVALLRFEYRARPRSARRRGRLHGQARLASNECNVRRCDPPRSSNADVVQVRAPANIALIAILILLARKTPKVRWVQVRRQLAAEGSGESSYTLQRWLLARNAHRGIVTINGVWPRQPAWIRTFYNPSLEQSEIERGRRVVDSKQLTTPLRMLFVGNLTVSKGAGRALEILREVQTRGVDAFLELIGDGDQRPHLEQVARDLGIEPKVRFWGWQDPGVVHEAYERAHVQLLPTSSEGWPKVLSEGMAYGVVPLAGAVSSIPQYLTSFATGAALPPDDIQAFASAIEGYVSNSDRWRRESRNARDAAQLFSFEHYLRAVDTLIDDIRARA